MRKRVVSRIVSRTTVGYPGFLGDDKTLNKLIITHVRCRRPLWDKSHKSYRRAAIRNRLWNQVAEDLGLNVEFVKTRWKTIRTRYSKDLRKRSRHSGARGRKGPSSWRLLPHLDFLREDLPMDRLRENMSTPSMVSASIAEAVRLERQTQPMAARSRLTVTFLEPFPKRSLRYADSDDDEISPRPCPHRRAHSPLLDADQVLVSMHASPMSSKTSMERRICMDFKDPDVRKPLREAETDADRSYERSPSGGLRENSPHRNDKLRNIMKYKFIQCVDCQFCKLPARYVQAIVMFACCAVAFCTRTNLSVAIVAMTTPNPNATYATFDWDSGEKSLVLSAFFWGYVITNIPAGQLSQRFGPKIFLAASMLVSSTLDLLLPIAATTWGWPGACAVRIGQGLAQGFTLTACYELLSKWAPPSERGRIVAFFLAAQPLGIIVGLSGSGAISASVAGWPTVFYATGSIGLLVGIWVTLSVADSPQRHRTMTQKEREYMSSKFVVKPSADYKRRTPWKEILTSWPMISLVLSHCGHSWAFWTILTKMPAYMDQVLKFDLNKNGVLSALPYFVKWIVGILVAWIADYLNNRQLISLTLNRKIFNSIGLWGPATVLIVLSFIRDDVSLCVALLTVAVALNGFTYVGFNINHLDLSPNYASTLFGITNAVANIMSLLAPIAVGLLVTDETNSDQWQYAFVLAALISFTGNLAFVCWGSAEVQVWNEPKERKHHQKSKLPEETETQVA